MSDGTPKWADLYGIDPDWPVSDTERENHVLRRILTDLIAELRDAHHPMADLDGEPSLCIQGCGILPCYSLSAAASAEARLKENGA